MRSKQRIFLNAPNGVRVKRHNVDDDIRFTTPAEGFDLLVAIWRNGRFIWIRNGYSA